MVCKSCGYINRDGVDFCRHCGISLKEKKRRAGKPRPPAVRSMPSARKANRNAEDEEDFLSPRNKKAKGIRLEEEERIPRGGANFKAATIAVGIFVIVCAAAFCIFAFDIPVFTSGGSVKIESISVPSETPLPEPTPGATPVPTVASSPA